MQVTTASLTDPTASETLCAKQKLDLDAKIDQAIDKTLSMLRSAVTNASVGFSLGIAGMIGTPTVSRVLCNQIVFGCYGMPHEHSVETEQFLSKIVWSNLGPYLGMTFASLVLGATGATLLLDAPAAARMIIKCACDLIIIMDRASRDNNDDIRMTLEKVKRSTHTYLKTRVAVDPAKGVHKRRQQLVHQAVNEQFPIFSGLIVKIHTSQKISEIRSGCMDIISRYRLAGPRIESESRPSLGRMSSSAASVGASRDSSLFSDTSTVCEPEESMDEDREDIQKLETMRATALEQSAE